MQIISKMRAIHQIQDQDIPDVMNTDIPLSYLPLTVADCPLQHAVSTGDFYTSHLLAFA